MIFLLLVKFWVKLVRWGYHVFYKKIIYLVKIKLQARGVPGSVFLFYLMQT